MKPLVVAKTTFVIPFVIKADDGEPMPRAVQRFLRQCLVRMAKAPAEGRFWERRPPRGRDDISRLLEPYRSLLMETDKSSWKYFEMEEPAWNDLFNNRALPVLAQNGSHICDAIVRRPRLIVHPDGTGAVLIDVDWIDVDLDGALSALYWGGRSRSTGGTQFSIEELARFVVEFDEGRGPRAELEMREQALHVTTLVAAGPVTDPVIECRRAARSEPRDRAAPAATAEEEVIERNANRWIVVTSAGCAALTCNSMLLSAKDQEFEQGGWPAKMSRIYAFLYIHALGLKNAWDRAASSPSGIAEVASTWGLESASKERPYYRDFYEAAARAHDLTDARRAMREHLLRPEVATRKPRGRRSAVASVAVALVVIVGVLAWSARGDPTPEKEPTENSESTESSESTENPETTETTNTTSYDDARRAVVLIRCWWNWETDDDLAHGWKEGTGFLIDSRTILTCRHVIAPWVTKRWSKAKRPDVSVTYAIWPEGRSINLPLPEDAPILDGEESEADASAHYGRMIVRSGRKPVPHKEHDAIKSIKTHRGEDSFISDLAALRLGLHMGPTPLAFSEDDIELGREYWLFGHGGGTPIMSVNKVRAGRHDGPVSKRHDEIFLLEATGVKRGDSGGPVVDEAGTVVGIAMQKVPGEGSTIRVLPKERVQRSLENLLK